MTDGSLELTGLPVWMKWRAPGSGRDPAEKPRWRVTEKTLDADLAFACTSGRAHPHVQMHRRELVHTYSRHLHITSFSTLPTPSPSAAKKNAWRGCVGSGCVGSSAEDQVTAEDTSSELLPSACPFPAKELSTRGSGGWKSLLAPLGLISSVRWHGDTRLPGGD